MALNPVAYTEKVVRNFLRYQLTTYPFADTGLHDQMRSLLSLDHTRHTPLLKGPYVSLSRSFKAGAALKDLVSDGVLHPGVASIAAHPNLYGHQERAIRAALSGKTTLVSTGTGSGKTECFLYPIISRCFELKDQRSPAGISAVLVYPMNALAEDQLGRLRDLLAGTGITFGMYVGKTPDRQGSVTGQVLPPGTSRAGYRAALQKAHEEGQEVAVHPAEEVCSREVMRKAGGQPRILLTNVKQLELLLTRQKDAELFDNARLDFLVFDEAHTFSGAQGAETAALIRRIKSFCHETPAGQNTQTVCVATSATIADPKGDGSEAKNFARRFFGVEESNVEVVGEQYESQVWDPARTDPGPIKGNRHEVLKAVLEVVDEGPDEAVGVRASAAFVLVTGQTLDPKRWQEDLYDKLVGNEVAYRLAVALPTARALHQVHDEIEQVLKRDVTEEELLVYLSLGAAARRDNRPLLRPVMHGFVRGVGGAVVTFPVSISGPKLWLSAEDAMHAQPADGGGPSFTRLPVLSCSTCGQHYFEHHVQDWEYLAKKPGGGEAVGSRHLWRPLDASSGGKRLVLTNTVIALDEDDDDPNKTDHVFLCRVCGALHPEQLERCDACSEKGPLVDLLTVQQKEENPGKLTRCISCGSNGRVWQAWYREPAKPVKATPVADVHVLAQDMIQHAERRRLLVFADNRQEAAFQAGWMRDHARRFRLRALMYERIKEGPVSIGDLTKYLDDRLDADDDLSRMLAPEVWQQQPKEAAGVEHANERKYYLRIQVLRELVTGVKQRIGLEPYGRMRVEYLGLDAKAPFIVQEATALNLAPQDLVEGIAGMLDRYRRGSHLWDSLGKMFSKFWGDGDREIQRGYFPQMQGVPKALKLRRDPGDDAARLTQWLSASGETSPRALVKKWGVDKDQAVEFVERLWEFLTQETKLLKPVTLTSNKGRALAHCTGGMQIDSDRILITPHQGLWRCKTCRRTQPRPSPFGVCQAWRCTGALEQIAEDPDNYDITLLDGGVHMVRPREHSAMVPSAQREQIERVFKGDRESVNTLVCTPTLELGVDIGALDAVLMRNVPPLPANYWQRVGRAGRRHRMAVNLTYARPSSHDRVYFDNPLKMLNGKVDPPRFNLKNELLIAKHVHAAILTRLQQLAKPSSSLSQGDREELTKALSEVLPPRISSYLFDERGHIRQKAFDVSVLMTVVSKHRSDLMRSAQTIFEQGWPKEDALNVTAEKLESIVDLMADQLQAVVVSLKSRLDWALAQMRRLDNERTSRGTLEHDEDSLYKRCDELIKKYKGQETRSSAQAEGFDDTETYGVLAAEGFLPGYGLEGGAIHAYARLPRYYASGSDFDLPRPPSIAVREYVPGNMIYANGNRFVARYFHFQPTDPELMQVDVQTESVSVVIGSIEATGAAPQASSLATTTLKVIPICDVDLAHKSHISDEEDYRFQLPVAVYGIEMGRHDLGQAYQWGAQDVIYRRGVHLRLVNVGAAKKVQTNQLGYPMSLVSGQSRSPFASETELDTWSADHQQRYSKPIERVGFYANIVADTLKFGNCASRAEAYSVLEAIRTGASRILDMERDDLEILVLGQPGREEVDGLLYDPMPGGSGLIEQLCECFEQVVEEALRIVEGCPSGCARSCNDCLLTFRNSFTHPHLDRMIAQTRLRELGIELKATHLIPPVLPAQPLRPNERPVNEVETRLRHLLKRAGFPQPMGGHQIQLGHPVGSTTPDGFWPGDDPSEPGTCLYLDGLSAHIHGNTETQAKDNAIRETLRNLGYEVVVITASELDDRDAIAARFYELALRLIGRDHAKGLKREPEKWFDD